MRKVILLLITFISVGAADSQVSLKDSLVNALKMQPKDSNRVVLLSRLSRIFLYEKPTVGISYALEGLNLSKELKFDRGVVISLNLMGNCYRMTGNFSKALELHFQALRIADKAGDKESIANSYHGISAVNEDQGYYQESLRYAHMVIKYASEIKNEIQLMRIQSNMGRSFEQLNILDSALHYEQNAYEIFLNKKDSLIAGNILGRLGNIHYKMGNDQMAAVYYSMGIRLAALVNDNNSLDEINHSLSIFHKRHGKIDSAIYYAKKSLLAAEALANPNPIIRSSLLLSENFESIGKIDSAYRYQAIALRTKDTLYTEQKIKQQQLLEIEEQERLREKAVAEKVLRDQKKRELEYFVVAISLISIMIIFLLLTRSFIVSPKTIVYFGTVALLLTFEFINLIIHPFLDNITNHSPALMLLALTIVAAILVPIHHQIEKWIKFQFVEKIKKIRLAAARKTIATLEKTS